MHWYLFNLPALDNARLICRATRQKQIKESLNTTVVFKGCVDGDKIPALRADKNTTIFVNVDHMRDVLSHVMPDVLKVKQETVQ